MQQMEQRTSMAKLTNDEHLLCHGFLGHANQGRQMRMRPNLDTGHDLPLELLDQGRTRQLDFLDGHLLPSPPSKEHLTRRPRPHRIAKLQFLQIDDVLVCGF